MDIDIYIYVYIYARTAYIQVANIPIREILNAH